MAVLQFACPYCTGAFAVENPPENQSVGCPHCGRAIAIPPGAGAMANEGVSQSVPPQSTPAGGAFIPFDFRDEPVQPASPSGRSTPAVVRQRDPFERRRRQQSRSIIVMVVCLALLAIAVVVLGRIQP